MINTDREMSLALLIIFENYAERLEISGCQRYAITLRDYLFFLMVVLRIREFESIFGLFLTLSRFLNYYTNRQFST